jgi:hypothetical protein
MSSNLLVDLFKKHCSPTDSTKHITTASNTIKSMEKSLTTNKDVPALKRMIISLKEEIEMIKTPMIWEDTNLYQLIKTDYLKHGERELYKFDQDFFESNDLNKKDQVKLSNALIDIANTYDTEILAIWEDLAK